jgi:peptidoglycan/xylan/chitin deacetylase (PgdA/CDA1 family)
VIVLWGVLAAIALAVLHSELALFSPVPRRALRILMYHRVAGAADRATVPAALLERHIAWLRASGYALVRLSDIVRHVTEGTPLPERPVLLTFDDGTVDVHEELLPLLRRLGAPAAVFVVPAFAGSARAYDGQTRRFASVEQLRELAVAGIELGLHTFEHRDLSGLSPQETAEDVARCVRRLRDARVPFEPALAYPYGAYPRKDARARAAFLDALRGAGLHVAFRIGNRVNALPLSAPLELQRSEIRGDEPFWTFRWKVWRGRRKGFA